MNQLKKESRRDDGHSHRHRSSRRSRSRSPVLHRRAFADTLEESLGGSSAAPLPTSSLMGSLLASKQQQEQQAKVAEEAAAAAVRAKAAAAASRAPAVGSMTAVANAAADMIKAARSGGQSVSGMEGALIITPNMDKETEQRRLDIEMQKRRERVERWRRERRLKQDIISVHQRIAESTRMAHTRKWNLEDEDEDEENETNKKSAKAEKIEDDVDPLDAYMQSLTEEIRQSVDPSATTPPIKKEELEDIKPDLTDDLKKPPTKKKEIGKGELMESNIDEMEYSYEEEEETIEDALAQLQKKEKLLPVDHSKIYYEPFRKNFYIEVPELIKMSKEDVKAYRISLENIRVRGKDCPKPLKTWVQGGISSRLLACLKRNKFDKPTPIQCQALPVIMSGRDMIGIAKTGSGKTLAFLVPLMRHLEHQRPLDPGEGPIALLLSPTRELALQIFKEAKKLCQSTDARVVCVYGGTGISEQIAELKRGAEIVVCTPGRMIDMLAANGGRVTNLRRCTYVVLDEADRMFDLGFEPQVMRIVENCRPDRQTLMFSATFPRQMELLARKALTNPIEIQVGGRSVVCSDVEQHAERNAGDVVRAFKLSDQPVPNDLLVMWNCYKMRMEAEGKKVYGSSGFRGKGFQFDESEALLSSEKRKAQKAALGLQDSDDEEPDSNAIDWDSKIEDMMTTKRKVADVIKPVEQTMSEVAAAVAAAAAAAQANQGPINAALALARQKAAQLGLTKNLNAPPPAPAVTRADAAQATAIAVLKGTTPSSTSGPAGSAAAAAAAAAASAAGANSTNAAPSSRTLAEQAAEKLNAKLGYSKQLQTTPTEEETPAPAGSDMIRRFEEELVINDFPQNVRWRVTGREMLNHLNDYCDVGVSVRGVYMPPSKSKTHVPDSTDDRPLYLCIEAVNERQIAVAKKEIMRVIKDEMLKSASSSASRGRYKVV
ncbi:putative ATP-dependent RNA helicase DDX46 [Fasciola gigantica]|uniref:Probable ATP-dependent RNA helicase DDX46 n=1 Tax=Fasciola gigantica TaxID=46835 RepID=A0A504YKM0_FASGI|nr:putative ATP-dependent RNA helicase DDX46 [Fasciola gigantica]